MKSKKIKFGVLGTSRVAIKGMLPAMRDSELAELLMIGSRTPEKAKEVSEQFNGGSWGTYEDVLKNENIDAVYVSLPNALHEEWVIKALRAGKHVICEKPTAISYGAALRMVSAARKNNVRLLEGFMFRYHPQHEQVRELIKNGTLGDLMKFDGCFGYAMPGKDSNAMNKSLAGGSFNDQAPYPVYSSRMIFGEEPESVFCRMQDDSQSGVNIKTDITLNYSNGRSAFASSIFGSYYQSTYSVLGTKASVRMGRAYAVPRDMEVKIFLDANDRVKEIVVPPADHFRLMLDDFCAEVARGSAKSKDYESDLLNQARVLEAARLSSQENRIVKVSEIVDGETGAPPLINKLSRNSFKRVVLTGGSGNLGRAILRSGIFENVLFSPSHNELDITDGEATSRFFKEKNPDAIIHSAALVRMAECEKNPGLAIKTNILGTYNLVKEVLKKEEEGKLVRFVYISTDGVYAGIKGNYSESDETLPYNKYGWTKLGGECLSEVLKNFCIVRTSFFDPSNIQFDTSATDMYSSKMLIDDLPKALALLLYSDFVGTVNIGDERKSHFDRYREFKPSLKPCTFEDISKGLNFGMAKDASLDITLWNNIKQIFESK